MRHGCGTQLALRTDAVQRHLARLSAEFLNAGPERCDAIGDEFMAVLNGHIIPVDFDRRTPEKG